MQQNPYNQPGGQPNYGAPIANPSDAGYGSNVQRGLRTIKRIDVGSAAKFGGVMSAAMTAIFGLVFLLFAGPIMSAALSGAGGRNAGVGLAGGFIGYLFAIILYGILGAIGGAIYAAIYNLVAGMMGGLQIEID